MGASHRMAPDRCTMSLVPMAVAVVAYMHSESPVHRGRGSLWASELAKGLFSATDFHDRLT
jgi:hypothetical protein